MACEPFADLELLFAALLTEFADYTLGETLLCAHFQENVLYDVMFPCYKMPHCSYSVV